MSKYLICNLKSNKTKDEMLNYANQIGFLKTTPEIELIICPSSLYFYMFKKNNYSIGAQDVSAYEEGSHTGEISASQLHSMNVRYALVGHSERRNIFKDTEEIISNKIKKSYHSHIHPIYFVGETEKDKTSNQDKNVLYNQITNIIDKIPDYKREKMLVVYEPVWSIGTGKQPSITIIKDRINYLKKLLNNRYGITIPVLYGGSVNKENIKELAKASIIDGFILGESSKDVDEVKNIYQEYLKKGLKSLM